MYGCLLAVNEVRRPGVDDPLEPVPTEKSIGTLSVSSTALSTGWRWAVVQPEASLKRPPP